MNINDCREYETSSILTVTPANVQHIRIGMPVWFQSCNGRFFLTSMSRSSHMEIRAETDVQFHLRSLCGLSNYVAQILAKDNTQVQIMVKIYKNVKKHNLCVCCTDSLIQMIEQNRQMHVDTNAFQLLHETFAMRLSHEIDACILGVRIKDPGDESNDLPDAVLVGGVQGGFLSLKIENSKAGQVLLAASKSSYCPQGAYSFSMLSGKLQFVDTLHAENSCNSCMALFCSPSNNLPAYNDLWREYGKRELAEKMEQFQFVGCTIAEYQPKHKGGVLIFSDLRQCKRLAEKLAKLKCRGDINLIVWNSYPERQMQFIDDYMNFILADDPEAGIQMMESVISESDAVEMLSHLFKKKSKDTDIAGTICISKNHAERLMEMFEAEGEIPVTTQSTISNGVRYLTLDLRGDITIYKRRFNAQKQIRNDTSGIPALADILDNCYEGMPYAEDRQTIQGITADVMKKCFPKNPPTPAQAEAVRIALNTPDIALIQGPPGTGKTTVITALIQRLDEISSGENDLFARNMICAFQHDAVTNAIERIDNFGLPAIKIGEKHSGSKSSLLMRDYTIENWTLQQIAKIENAHPEALHMTQKQVFDESYYAYRHSGGSIQAAIHVLEAAHEALEQIMALGTSIGDSVGKLLKKYRTLKRESELFNDDNSLVTALIRIPRSAISYEDHGRERIKRSIYLMQTYGERFQKEIDILEAFMKQEPNSRDYQALSQILDKQISSVKPKPMIFSCKQDNILLNQVLDKVCELLNSYHTDPSKKEDVAIAEFYYTLCNDYGYVKESIRAYSAVAGATNQQASSEALLSKKIEPVYENVVIDEAARSNPLDLLIPMSFAKERIILVGDHRQLPQIVDDRIVKDIADSVSEEEIDQKEIKKLLETSLFERLKNTLVDLEKKDGIRRYITLDKQFRTHPILGQFVSRQFYEAHDERERFESPRSADQFTHDLPGLENKAAVWLNVPHGSEEKTEGSWKRYSEALALVSHLKEMMDSEAGQKLTFGVITFYAAQRDLILETMCRFGMAKRNRSGGEIEIDEKYQKTYIMHGNEKRSINRLRIGSVDAFQGMEFDVVYLSVVRFNQERHYGFLAMENRLCVAMSRQKRLLICAGDIDMFTCEAGRKTVPALNAFYELCRKDRIYGAVISDKK